MLAYLISAPMSGDDVVALQERLLELGYDPGRPGGVFDERTEAALRRFQREYGLVPDGLCGPATLRSLRQLGRKVTGGRPHLLREQELLRQAGPRLRGKRIVVDPGHGGPDRGVVVGRRGRGRPDVGPGPPAGRPDGGHRHGRDALPAGEHLPDRAGAGRVRQQRRRRPGALAAHRRQLQHARAGPGHLPLRQRLGRHVHRRRGAGRLHPARAAHPHRDVRLPQPGPRPGSCCG